MHACIGIGNGIASSLGWSAAAAAANSQAEKDRPMIGRARERERLAAR